MRQLAQGQTDGIEQCPEDRRPHSLELSLELRTRPAFVFLDGREFQQDCPLQTVTAVAQLFQRLTQCGAVQFAELFQAAQCLLQALPVGSHHVAQ